MPTAHRWKLPIAVLLLTLHSSCAVAAAPKDEAHPLPSTMKAVRIHQYGGPETLRLEEVPRPSPGPGEVLIRAHAAGINPVDSVIREGRMRERLERELPLTLGVDVSGVVEQVGAQVTRFKRGEAVYAFVDIRRGGTYAEYVIAREQEVAPKPKTIDHIQAAGVPATALTAWQALVDKADLRKGQTILIHGAAGGVGTMAVQLAKIRGAKVIGTASESNLEYLKSIGADEVINYRTTRFEEMVRDVDVVLDTVGGETQERSWKVLKKGGLLVSIRNSSVEESVHGQGARAAYILVKPDAKELAEIGKLIDSGKLKPVISTILPLQEVRRAHELSQSRHTRGKIVLRIVE